MSTAQDTASLTRELARIERTHLGFEDHGILTLSLQVNYGSASQGIGGYPILTNAGPWIDRILQACGVGQWEKLVGRTIYVLTDGHRRVVGIENLPTEQGNRFLFAEVTS